MAGWNPDRAEMYAAQDDCFFAIVEGRPMPARSLKQLPPWRAVMLAEVAARAGVGLELGTLAQLTAEAAAAGATGKLGDWWKRPVVGQVHPVV